MQLFKDKIRRAFVLMQKISFCVRASRQLQNTSILTFSPFLSFSVALKFSALCRQYVQLYDYSFIIYSVNLNHCLVQLRQRTPPIQITKRALTLIETTKTEREREEKRERDATGVKTGHSVDEQQQTDYTKDSKNNRDILISGFIPFATVQIYLHRKHKNMQNTCEIPRYHSLISFTMKNWLMHKI